MSNPSSGAAAPGAQHARLLGLIEEAKTSAASAPELPVLGMVYPCDALSMEAAAAVHRQGIARVVLMGPLDRMQRAADEVGLDLSAHECVHADSTTPASTAVCAVRWAREGRLNALMKGSLHTDELMSAVVSRDTGLRTSKRITHAFVFDLPRYHKLLALADCVVNISPDLKTKRDVLGNAAALLQTLGVAKPKVAIVAAVESVNPAIPATLDAQALVEISHHGAWPDVVVEGPFGFDNAISAESARLKGMNSLVAGDADLMVMPDLNAGNMLYKSFVYIGGGECAGLVLGAQVPIVLTSRADSLLARTASVALATLAGRTH